MKIRRMLQEAAALEHREQARYEQGILECALAGDLKTKTLLENIVDSGNLIRTNGWDFWSDGTKDGAAANRRLVPGMWEVRSGCACTDRERKSVGWTAFNGEAHCGAYRIDCNVKLKGG